MKNRFILIFVFLLFIPGVYAHPGRTASDGCHYCRTNCDYWGEEYDERHCHSNSDYKNDESENKNLGLWALGLGGVAYGSYSILKKGNKK